MTTEPKFYTQNAVDVESIFTVSHGSGTIGNIYDRDSDTQWLSSGANSDSTQISIEIQFSEARDIDTVLIVNHNLKDVTVTYWNGAAYAAWANQSSLTLDFLKL